MPKILLRPYNGKSQYLEEGYAAGREGQGGCLPRSGATARRIHLQYATHPQPIISRLQQLKHFPTVNWTETEKRLKCSGQSSPIWRSRPKSTTRSRQIWGNHRAQQVFVQQSPSHLYKGITNDS